MMIGDTLLLATHNKGKIAEIKTLLSPYVKNLITAAEWNLPEPDETGESFHENAALKAVAAARATGIPALADDSGVCMTALNGAPGIHSARWVKDKNYQTAIDRIFRELNGAVPQAEFICVLAIALPDNHVTYYEGRCTGMLLPQPRGLHGFGYDPYFIPNGHTQTFAELGNPIKDKISARALAFAALMNVIPGEALKSRRPRIPGKL